MSYTGTSELIFSDLTDGVVDDESAHASDPCSVGRMDKATLQVTATKTLSPGDLTALLEASEDGTNWATVGAILFTADGSSTVHIDSTHTWLRCKLTAAATTNGTNYWTVTAVLTALYHLGHEFEEAESQAGNPLEFPFPSPQYPGKMLTAKKEEDDIIDHTADPPTLVVLNLGAGQQGVIRRIQIVFQTLNNKATTLQAVWAALRLVVTVDGEVDPAVDVALGELAALGLVANDQTLQVWQTPMFSVNLNTWGAQDGQCQIDLSWPMPFSNGIKVEIRPSPGFEYWTAPSTHNCHTWVYVSYQNVLPPCWNRNYRFRASRFQHEFGVFECEGTATTDPANHKHLIGTSSYFVVQLSPTDMVAYQYRAVCSEIDHIESETSLYTVDNMEVLTGAVIYGIKAGTPEAPSIETIFDRPAGKRGVYVGSLASFNQGEIGEITDNFFEYNVQFHVDREPNASWEASSTEDYFGSGFYFGGSTHAKPILGLESGQPCVDHTSKCYTAYRIHRDDPIPYSDGIYSLWQWGAAGQNLYNPIDVTWVHLYYEEV